jgi:hypothetical protein
MTKHKATTDWDGVKSGLYGAAKGYWFELDALFAERDQLVTEIARLRKALEPFVALAEDVRSAEYQPQDRMMSVVLLREDGSTFTYGYIGIQVLEAARAALSSGKE